MVAEYLMQLNEVGSVSSSQLAETFMQFGPSRLRQRIVGGFSAQQVAEAEGILPGSCALSGRMSSLRTSPVRWAVS